jgi:hypothetical protein
MLAMITVLVTLFIARSISTENVNGDESSGVGRINLHSYSERMYTGTVQLGSPAKSFDCVFDTG